ncbi:MAG: DinB family protein [Candidatus Dormibacteria bacterium]
MITDIAAFLKYFDGVNRRAIRDVGSLPPEAQTWRPPAGAGENAWSIGELVSHMAASRLFFGHAYRAEGWRPDPWPEPTATREQWIAALEGSTERMHELLEGTPDAWLQRRVEAMDTPGQTLAGWRVLMMGVEHDVHHRSQIDTYAGIAGWEVQQIYGRKAEDVGLTPRR